MRGYITLLVIVLPLWGCQLSPVKPAGEDAIIAPEPVIVAPSSRPSKPSRASLVDKLLQQGEEALARERLTQPVHDNAYDRFAAVLMIQPDNAQALAGFQAISLACADRMREALAMGRIGAARNELQRIGVLFPGSPLLAPLHTALEQAAAADERQRLQDGPAEGEELVSLNASDIRQRNDLVKQLLEEVATRISETDQSVLIYARSDAEGRWIYKVMKEAVEHYRIRGDIRISNRPALKLMPPL